MARNLIQKSMELGAKVNGTWCKIQWSGVRRSMELAAKTNEAGCEGQRSWLQKSMELAANETWLGTWYIRTADLHIRTYRLMLMYVDLS